MKRTLSANIAGLVFNIEEDAYQVLLDYLVSIKENFPLNERDEIMEDIEARIAEIFSAKIEAGANVITMADVDTVKATMGEPEDYSSDEYEDNSEAYTDTEENQKKRIYRNPDDAKIFGVCSGIANYLGWDVTAVRIIFVLMFILGGSGGLIYFVLFLVLPEANSTADKLRMKGQKVNVENIKSQFYESKESIQKQGEKAKEKFKSGFRTASDTTAKVGKFIAKALGLFILFIGIVFFISGLVILFHPDGIFPLWDKESGISLNEFMDLTFSSPMYKSLMIFGGIFALVGLITSFVSVGIKLLFGLKSQAKAISISSLVFMIAGAILCCISGVNLAMNYSSHESIEYSYTLDNPNTDTLYITCIEDNVLSNMRMNDENLLECIELDKEVFHACGPHLAIRSTSDTAFSLTVIKESYGKNLDLAYELADNFAYNLKSKNNTLSLSNYLSVQNSDKWRAQDVDLILNVPIGKNVKFSDNVMNLLSYRYSRHLRDGKNAKNNVWKMDNDWLKCTDCEDKKEYKSKTF